MTHLLRLIHVSDLHFGDDLENPGWLVGNFNWFPGVEGVATHDFEIINHLADAVRSQRLMRLNNDETPIRVVDTGDLTTWGTASAFENAFQFVRGVSPSGAALPPFNPRDPASLCCLRDDMAPTVPGNHDVWHGKFVGVTLKPAQVASATGDCELYFTGPGGPHAAYLPDGDRFPYRVSLFEPPVYLTEDIPGIPAIHLYGLDSTRVNTSPGYGKGNENILAYGRVDEAQIMALRQLVAQEPYLHCLRIAAIHHPLGYPKLSGSNQPPDPNTHPKRLLNVDQVLAELHEMNFGMALCGHQHRGFTQPSHLAPAPQVCSAGTATQMIALFPWERAALGIGWETLEGYDDLRLFEAAEERYRERANEFRVYDFLYDPATPDVRVIVSVFRFNPRLLSFEMLEQGAGSDQFALPVQQSSGKTHGATVTLFVEPTSQQKSEATAVTHASVREIAGESVPKPENVAELVERIFYGEDDQPAD